MTEADELESSVPEPEPPPEEEADKTDNEDAQDDPPVRWWY